MTDQGDNRGRIDPIKIISGVLVAIVVAGFAVIQSTVSSVNQWGPQIEQMQADIDELDEWQDEWPQTGELSTDVRQNENIKFMLQRLEEQDDDIEALKDRLRAVELDEVGP